MTAFVVATVAVLAFAVAIVRSGLGPVVESLYRSALEGISAMLDSELDDLSKERAVRRSGFALVGGAVRLLWRFALAVAAAVAVVLAADLAAASTLDDTVAVMLRLDFIIGVSVAAIAAAWLLGRWRRGRASGADDALHAYGDADQLVHKLAFASARVMKAAARLDNWVFARSVGRVPRTPPIFIISLARGGTTALLNALHRLPTIATHEYRDMPFVTAPLLWSRLGSDRTALVERRERAHGDGMEIGLDSPEAFDEVLWRAYWPEKYRNGRIETWHGQDVDQHRTSMFLRHYAKVTLVRCREAVSTASCRYVSKNNANIARLRVLDVMFPGCEVVVALRHPSAHAASLLRQHQNFLRLHAEDDFIRRYMRDIGHLEFGLLHQPIAFDGFDPGSLGPEDPDYWLMYWIAAFHEVAAYGRDCHVVLQEDLRDQPQATMERLCSALGVGVDGVDFTAEFRPGPDPAHDDLFSPELVERANALYSQLAEHALRPHD